MTFQNKATKTRQHAIIRISSIIS